MLSRRKGQEKLLLVVYQYFFYINYEERPSLNEIFSSIFSKEEKQEDEFYKNVFIKSIQTASEAIKHLSPFLIEWTFDRLSLIDQAILVLAYVEHKYFEIPKAVAINVFVDLSKKYSAEDDTYKFINSILDKAL